MIGPISKNDRIILRFPNAFKLLTIAEIVKENLRDYLKNKSTKKILMKI